MGFLFAGDGFGPDLEFPGTVFCTEYGVSTPYGYVKLLAQHSILPLKVSPLSHVQPRNLSLNLTSSSARLFHQKSRPWIRMAMCIYTDA